VSDGRPVPAPSALSAPFWDATRRGELVMQRCTSCRRLVWYPRYACPGCGCHRLGWERLSGLGTIYAVSIHHRSPVKTLAARTPYAVVLVDLAEGARMMSNVFGPAPAVGEACALAWEPLPDGRQLPVFERR
jgi:uncharacterized OB-fold protein